MNDKPRDNLVRANLQRADVSTDGRTMTGYPIVFNKWTTINSWEGKFRERIAPGAINQTLSVARDQIKVLFNHGMDPSIGDKPLGRATVMEPDKRGLYVEVPLSDTSYNNDLLALMRDGAIDGQSFRFSVVKEEWDKEDSALPERTITELNLYEFGPVTFPAYEATTVGIRSRDTFAAWMGLDLERRAQIAQIMGVEVRTLELEAARDTSSTGAAAQEPPEQSGAHSGAVITRLRRGTAAADKLRSYTNARPD